MRICAAVLLSLCFLGQGAQAETDEQQLMKICKSIHSLATTIMESRQMSVSMPDMMEAVGGKETSEYFRLIVQAAYDEPSYQSPEVRDRVIREFANRQYGNCLKAMQK